MPLSGYHQGNEWFNGENLSLKADKDILDMMNKLANETGTTLYMLLLAVYNVLLHKFTGQEDIAGMYGSNITKKSLNNAKILTPQSPLFSYKQIDKILQGVDNKMLKVAVLNWNEDYNIGKRTLIQSIASADNPLEQLMNIWADVFSHQNGNDFIDLMIKNGIDGISIQKKEDETYYVIYNKAILI
jgi:hypothetical protein